MDNFKLKLYLIQSIKVDSPEHCLFKILQSKTFQLFPTIVALRQNEKDPSIIQLLSIQNLKPFQIKNSMEDAVRIKLCFNTLKSLWYLHQFQYFLGPKNIEQFIYYNKSNGHMKFNPYHSKIIEGYKYLQAKKDKNVAKNGIQLSFDLPKNPKHLDVWKWAVFTAKNLFSFSLQNYIDKVFSAEKFTQYAPQIVKKSQFLGVDQLLQVLARCLKVNPNQRPIIQQIMTTFHKIIINLQQLQDKKMGDKVRHHFIEKQHSIKPILQFDIKDDVLLTDQLKKKVSNQFIKNSFKPPKDFKPLFKASRFEFSPKAFYQQCSKNSRLLFIIDSTQSGVICCYIEPQISLIDKFGLSGYYVSDPSVKSFIYSVKNQQTYKLIFKDKAFRCVPGKGPIIGDGDVILGNSTGNNWCNFPRSYQSGKNKKLTPKPQFSIRNYDVYTLTFDQSK